VLFPTKKKKKKKKTHLGGVFGWAGGGGRGCFGLGGGGWGGGGGGGVGGGGGCRGLGWGGAGGVCGGGGPPTQTHPPPPQTPTHPPLLSRCRSNPPPLYEEVKETRLSFLSARAYIPLSSPLSNHRYPSSEESGVRKEPLLI